MMGKESTCSRLSRSVALCISPKPTAEIANVPRMRRGKVGGNCLSLPQRERNCIGNNLLLLFPLLLLQESLSTRVSNFICGGGDRVSACGSRKFSMAKSSIIAVSSSISCSLSSSLSLSGANVAMSQKNVQLFAGRQYLPLNPTAGGMALEFLRTKEGGWRATHVNESIFCGRRPLINWTHFCAKWPSGRVYTSSHFGQTRINQSGGGGEHRGLPMQ